MDNWMQSQPPKLPPPKPLPTIDPALLAPGPVTSHDADVAEYTGLHTAPATLSPSQRQKIALRYRLAVALIVAALGLWLLR
jgi:hypothetical protein